MDVDSFMRHGLDNLSEESSDEEQKAVSVKNNQKAAESSKNKPKKKLKKLEAKKLKTNEAEKSTSKQSEVHSFKQSLGKIQEKDPDFYEFLKTNDADLLNFDVSSDEEDEEFSDEDEKNEAKFHRPPEKLEIASDDSDFEPEEEKDEEKSLKKIKKEKKKSQDSDDEESAKKKSLSLKQIKRIEAAIDSNPNLAVLHELGLAFAAAVSAAGAESAQISRFVVEDGTVFNAVLRLCLTKIPKVWWKFLKHGGGKKKKKSTFDWRKLVKDQADQGQWKKLKSHIKSYLHHLILLIGELQEDEVILATLKHARNLLPYCACFPKMAKVLMKKFIRIWAQSDDESCRVLAFLCVLQLTKLQPEFFEPALKKFYFSYVQNTRLVTAGTWPLINFMQRSFAEFCGIRPEIAYQYAFVYIRQMAIHLRNATVSKKQEQIQTILNWQFVQCLYIWARMLATNCSNSTLEPLIYPLTQLAFGTARLLPGAKYLPLRFHCARSLLILAVSTKFYFPIATLVLEALSLADFGAKVFDEEPEKALSFDCTLKISNSQMKEAGYKEMVVENATEILFEFANVYAKNIAFPELVNPINNQIRQILKKCRVPSLNRQLKLVVQKFQEHANFVDSKRRQTSLNLSDEKSVRDLEEKLKNGPFEKFYADWRKQKDSDKIHHLAQKHKIVDLDVQKVPRIAPKDSKKKKTEFKSFAEMLEAPSSSEDEMNLFEAKIAEKEASEKSEKKSGTKKSEKKSEVKKSEAKKSEVKKEKKNLAVKSVKKLKALQSADVVTDFVLSDDES